MGKFKSRDDTLRDENDRRISNTCAEPECMEPGTLSSGTNQADKLWYCTWHHHNPRSPIPPEEYNRPRGDWVKQAREDWLDGLNEAQVHALRRKDGEGRKAYAARMSEIMRRLAKRAGEQLHGRLPYDKRLSADGEALSGDREASLARAKAEAGDDTQGVAGREVAGELDTGGVPGEAGEG